MTVNELTLGIERLMRAGDPTLVNRLRDLLAQTIGAPKPPTLKVTKPAAPAGAP